MKNTLFDLLGEIDDKFYEEALWENDPGAKLRPEKKKPVLRVPFIAAGAAAAAALVIMLAYKLPISEKPNVSGAANSNSISEGSSSLGPGAEYIGILASDIEECKKILAENAPGADITESRIMDINLDGKDEIVVLTNGGYGISVFSKNEDGISQTGHFAQGAAAEGPASLDMLYKFDKNGEKYWYYCASYNNGVFYGTYILGAVKFDGEEYFTENLLSFGTLYYSDLEEPVKQKFYRKGWDKTDIGLDGEHKNDIPREEFKALWEQYDAAPDFEELDLYGGEVIKEYDFGDGITGKLVGTGKIADSSLLLGETYYLGCKAVIDFNGTTLETGLTAPSVELSAPSHFTFKDIPNYNLRLIKLADGYILAFSYKPEATPEETTFFAVFDVDGTPTMFDSKLYGQVLNEINVLSYFSGEGADIGISFGVFLSDNLSVNGNTISDNEKGVYYTFDFDNIRTAMYAPDNYSFGYDFTTTKDGTAFEDEQP